MSTEKITTDYIREIHRTFLNQTIFHNFHKDQVRLDHPQLFNLIDGIQNDPVLNTLASSIASQSHPSRALYLIFLEMFCLKIESCFTKKRQLPFSG